MAICEGKGDDHCCYLPNVGVCQYLEENTVSGRRWACGLYRELGSWKEVHIDSRYTKNVRPALSLLDPNLDCGDWPRPGETCNECGVKG